jgi:hypothetical protein
VWVTIQPSGRQERKKNGSTPDEESAENSPNSHRTALIHTSQCGEWQELNQERTHDTIPEREEPRSSRQAARCRRECAGHIWGSLNTSRGAIRGVYGYLVYWSEGGVAPPFLRKLRWALKRSNPRADREIRSISCVAHATPRHFDTKKESYWSTCRTL